MSIEEIVDRFENELPGYSLVGYEELAFPVFSAHLYCLFQTERQLPVIEEFVLNYYDADVPKYQIHKLLGIDAEIVDNAWWKLIEAELINLRTKSITTEGKKYIKENKLDDFEKIFVKVNVDGLTGKMKKESSMLMSRTAVKDQQLRALHPLVESPDIEDIDLRQVKNVVKEYKKTSPESYPGEIIDVFHVETGNTKFKRLNLLVFRNNDSIRFQIYDGSQKLDGYEAKLHELEEKGFQVIKTYGGKYFDHQYEMIEELSISVSEKIGPGKVWRGWCDNLKLANSKIIINFPLIDICTPNEQITYLIEKALEKGIKTEIIFSGQEFLNSDRKNKIDYFFKLKKIYKNLVLTHIPQSLNKCILVDDFRGIISVFIKNELCLPSSKQGLYEEGFHLTKEEVKLVNDYYSNKRVNHTIKKIDLITTKQSLENKLKNIVKQVYTLDERMREHENIGWLGEVAMPEMTNLLDSPVAKNENTFKTFINAMNKSLVESIEQATKQHGVKKYFWNTFKEKYPKLQRQLYKIRLYRNYMNHLVLEEQYKNTFFEFLNEDINGCFPQFVDNGFLILQTKIILDLEEIVLKQIQDLG
ncbi:hypothetical protein [Dehalobacter sp. TBBPA1]|uniref:hypothetical protein n=1 Tax=Dehalobacter sp. TBBPA1 TaxID=3235037 RepID=UPI0034A1D88A